MASITRFITTKLKLKVNEQKSAVARPWERKFLGFSFTANRAQTANRAESGDPVQRQGSGTDATDARALAVALPNAYFDSLGIPRLTGGR